jgi:hypothetical protein
LSSNSGLEITSNAVFSGGLWSLDNAADGASRLRLRPGPIELQFQTAGAAPWSDVSWINGIQVTDGGGGFVNLFLDTVITGSLDVTGLGNNLTVGGDITATNGNVSATAGNVIASNNVTAGNDVTATAGNVTALAGDITAIAGDVLAGDEFLYGTVKTGRFLVIPLFDGIRTSGADLVYTGMDDSPNGDNAITLASSTPTTIVYSFRLPHDTELEEVRIIIDADTTSTMACSLYVSDDMPYGGSAPIGEGTILNLSNDTPSGTNRRHMALSGGNHVSDSDDTLYQVVVVMSSVFDILYGIRVKFTDPGPRN